MVTERRRLSPSQDAEGRPQFVLFNCALCCRVVQLCRRHYRGNRYCSPRCAAEARALRLRRVRADYQRTPEGRRRHANCQRAYRLRLDAEASVAEPGAALKAELVTSNTATPPVHEADTPSSAHSWAAGSPSGRCNRCDAQVGPFCSLWLTWQGPHWMLDAWHRSGLRSRP